MDQLLALFPLHTVLFPGATISLHIHEERYKQMIRQCAALKEPFGVVLIREGDEVGAPAEPYEVGTTALIANALRFNDGRMFIVAEGQKRFRIQYFLQKEPFLLASVALMDEHVTVEQRVQAEQLCTLYQHYGDAVAKATGMAQTLSELPRDPVAMSFQISAQLQVPYLSKQQLLEADLETRLDALTTALMDEMRFLPPAGGASLQHGERWSIN